ncbi:MAG: hypothetical protein U5K51_17165 [Flavobacteriaceae bacterium]|nr:hypothetical protein [Flavobacteriaceae bacterium]
MPNPETDGITYKHFFFNDRMTVTGGWFNEWLSNDLNFSESADHFTGRITGLAKYYNEGKQFIHMGLGVRYTEAEKGQLRLRGKNESNISSNYVDTGLFDANDLINLSVEQLWSLDNFSFSAGICIVAGPMLMMVMSSLKDIISQPVM